MKGTGVFAIFLSCLAFFTPQYSWALTVDKAEIVGDRVKVLGSDAEPHAIIRWEAGGVEEEVGQANANGNFHFFTDLLPPEPQCTGIVIEGNFVDFVNVVVDKCRSELVGFYSAPQDTESVAPGESGTVQSFCDLGDFVISGQLVIFPLPHDFRIQIFGLVSDGSTGQESWVLSGFNADTGAADIRVNARCADLLPTH